MLIINIIKPTKFYFLYTVYDRLHAHRILPPQKEFFNY